MNKKTTLLIMALCAVLIPAIGQEQAPMHKEKSVSNEPAKKPIQHVKTKSGQLLWGAGAVVGSSNGEFQNGFTNSGTAGSYTPSSWTALSVFDGSSTPGNAYWTQTMSGTSQGAYWGSETTLASPTQANGAAIFDSDFMDNGGVAGAFGTGTAPSAHEGWLVSPRIDLTGYTDSIMAARFWCKWRAFNVTEFTLSFSSDDGLTWTDHAIPPVLPSTGGNSNEGWVNIYLTNEIMGVVNLTQCRVRFKIHADYYYAMIDDFSLETGDAVDLTIAPNDITAPLLTDQMYQMQIMNNRHIPVGGISDPRDFTYGAVVQNEGGGTSFAIQNAELYAEISRDNGGVWTQVHKDTLSIPTIAYDDPGVVLTDTLSATSWAIVGDYRVWYIVNSSEDDNGQNDTLVEYFSINDNSYASKVPQDANGLPAIETQVFPAGSNATFEFGSSFDFPNAGTNSFFLDSISQGFHVPTNYAGPMDINYTVRFYEWEDVNLNELIDDIGELTLVALGYDTLSGAGNSLGTSIMKSTPIIDANTLANGYALEDNKIYLATVSLVAAENGQSSFGATDMIWLACAESVNYGMNYFSTNTRSYFLHLIDNVGTENLFDQGFGPTRVPSMGLHLSEECLPVTADLSFSDTYLQVDFTDVSTTQGDPVDSWSWDFGDGNTATMQNPTHTYAAGGQYEVCLTVTNNCSSDTYCDSVTVAPNTNGLSDHWKDNLMIYPNPAENHVTIKNLPEGTFVLELRNLLGQVVYRTTTESATELEIPVSKLASGQYTLMIQSKSDVLVKQMMVR